MIVHLYFNDQHDHALVTWDWRHGHSIPCDVLNEAQARLFNETGRLSWHYVWWDEEGYQRGLLFSEVQDFTREDVDAVCVNIIDYNENSEIIPEGWEATEYEVDA